MSNQDYDKQIEVLNSILWEYRALRPRIDKWLANFGTDQEREYALYLLSRLMYFNSSNIRNLLKALYRDLYRYPVIERIRKNNNNTLDKDFIEREFKKEFTTVQRNYPIGSVDLNRNHSSDVLV